MYSHPHPLLLFLFLFDLGVEVSGISHLYHVYWDISIFLDQ